jgi:serine/threonine protein kinase
MHLGEDHPFIKCGTPGFVAPEVFNLQANETLNGFASDVFSMGVVFHLLLTGEHLFRASSPKELFIKNSKMDFDLTLDIYQKIDPVSISLLQKMLQKDPIDRISAS